MSEQKNYSLECGICPYCRDNSEDTVWIENRLRCFCRRCHEDWRLPIEVLGYDIELGYCDRNE